MEALNRNHGRIAFESPGTPVCPHAVAFLYLDAVPTPAAQGGQTLWRKVVAASRVVPDTPDVWELATLLFRLARLASERYLPTSGGFDPAAHMSVYRDETTGHAEYVSVGVSTLDMPALPWEQARTRADDIDDLGGRRFVLLADHTAILVYRPPRRVHDARRAGGIGPHERAAPAVYQQKPRPTL